MSTLEEQKEIEEKIEKIFTDIVSGKKVKAYISSDKKVLNPFSTLNIRFITEGQEVQVEALLKCDTIGNCKYCFTRNFSHIVLIKDRAEKLIDTAWDNVLNWEGEPVFEDSYFDKITIKKDLIVGDFEDGEYERMTVYRYQSLLIERKNSLYRVSLLERDKIVRYFTEHLEWEI